jgi:hypothetical protein
MVLRGRRGGVTVVVSLAVAAAYIALLIHWPDGLDRRGGANPHDSAASWRGSMAEQLSPRPRRSNPFSKQSTDAAGDHASSHARGVR